MMLSSISAKSSHSEQAFVDCSSTSEPPNGLAMKLDGLSPYLDLANLSSKSIAACARTTFIRLPFESSPNLSN